MLKKFANWCTLLIGCSSPLLILIGNWILAIQLVVLK